LIVSEAKPNFGYKIDLGNGEMIVGYRWRSTQPTTVEIASHKPPAMTSEYPSTLLTNAIVFDIISLSDIP